VRNSDRQDYGWKYSPCLLCQTKNLQKVYHQIKEFKCRLLFIFEIKISNKMLTKKEKNLYLSYIDNKSY